LTQNGLNDVRSCKDVPLKYKKPSCCWDSRPYSGPSRATAGPGKPLSRALSEFSYVLKSRRREEGNVGGLPLIIRLGVWGSVVSSSSGFRPKMDFMHIEVRKKPPGPPFSLYLSDGGAHKTSRGPGKIPPFSTGLTVLSHSRRCIKAVAHSFSNANITLLINVVGLVYNYRNSHFWPK